MSTQRLVIIGAGGHAKVIYEAVVAANAGEVVGFIDARAESGPFGLPVLGGDEMFAQLAGMGISGAVVAIGSNGLRQRLGAELRGLGIALPAIIHPSAFVSPSARIGDGAVIMARAVVGTMTTVGALAIVNSGAVIDHDGRIGAAAHVAPGCAIAGTVTVGERSLVGVGSSVRPGIIIGNDVVVGAGSAVVSDIADGAVVGGAPARPLRRGAGS